MKILFVAGMLTKKLESKIFPVQALPRVEKIFLVRKEFYSGNKIECYSPPIYFSKISPLSEAYRVLAILFILIKYRPEIIIAAGLVMHGVYSIIMGSIFGAKTVLLLMGQNEVSFERKTMLNRILLKIVLHADIIGVRGSNSMNKLIQHGFPEQNLFLAHNHFNFGDFSQQKMDKIYDLIFIGHLYKEKRLDLLVEIVRRLVNVYHLEVKLIIVGDGPQRKNVVSAIKQKNVKGSIILSPHVGRDELILFLNRSKILVLTSEAEGLPMAIIEAMSCGLPVIAFNVADISDVIKDGENGFIIKYGQLDDYCGKVKRLLSDQQLYLSFCENALKIRTELNNQYSLENIMSSWNQVFDKLSTI